MNKTTQMENILLLIINVIKSAKNGATDTLVKSDVPDVVTTAMMQLWLNDSSEVLEIAMRYQGSRDIEGLYDELRTLDPFLQEVLFPVFNVIDKLKAMNK